MKRLALILGVVALAVPAAAWAHATLKQESPGFAQEVQSSPRQVVMHFDQITQFPVVQVLDQHGRNYAGTATVDQLVVTTPVRKLPTGTYTIRWHVLSSDGHVVSGVWTFGVRVKALPPTEAFGASGPTRTEHLVRWLYFLSLAIVIGSLGFRLIVLRGLELGPRLAGRLTLVSLLGVIAVIQVGILAFCLRCEDVLQLPFGKFIYGDLSPISGGTRFGKAFVAMTLGFAVAAAFVYLAWLLERDWLYWPALLLAVGFVAGLSVSGHDGVDPGSSWLSEVADWVHLTAGSLWIGGLVTLTIAVWPLGREIRREAFLRFSRLAVLLVALVLAAGTYLAIVRLPHLHDLWSTGYGRVLIIKISLVATAVGWGGIHHFFVRPKLAGASDKLLGGIGRSLIGESAVAVAILLLAAVLVDSKPPPRPTQTSSSNRAAYAGAVGASSWRK